MKISQINIQPLLEDIASGMPQASTIGMVERLLFHGLEDTGAAGDFVMVFGSPTCTRYRAPLGARLLLSGRAGFLLLTGGKELPGTQTTEAEAMKSVALAEGVAEERILLENASLFTHENVRFSIDIMKQALPGRPWHILAVTSGYHMRRVMLNFQHYWDDFPAGSTVSPCPAASDCARKENWSLTEKGRGIIARQCRALYRYVQLGYLPDIDF